MPPRARKTNSTATTTATAQTEATPAPEAENKAADAAAVETKIPDVAPLDPPAPPKEPEPKPTIGASDQVIASDFTGRIVDHATGDMPPNPDGVFQPVGQFGERARSMVRLVEHVGLGTYGSPTMRLLVPVGAEIPTPQADRIIARLRSQLGQD